MLRRSLRRSTASVRHGAFQRSQPLLLFFRKRPKELHRVARQRPWWESAAIICGLVLFINMTSATFYAFNRWYQSWRPSGNDIFVATTIDEKLFSRPDLAVAAVRMAFFHALSNSSEPFGQPMVAPECYRSESEELLSLVQDLHSSQPMYSMADLWAIVSAKALARLGGPNLQVLRGREDIHEPNNSYLRISPPAIPENQRDVLNLKRVLSHRGFSVEQIVALIGASRNIGFHESSNFHTKQIVKPNVRNARQAGPAADEFHLPDSIEKCTLDPFVFGGEYFDYLLNYNWKKESKFFGTSQRYRCIDTDRRREVVFLDPFSEKSVEADRRRIESREKANSALETLNRGAGENAPRTGRSGEAQTIAVTEDVSSAVAKEELEVVDPSAIVNVCDSISMKDIDMMLLDDALTCGWVHRMTENEVEFYSIAGETLLQIQKFGYNENQLFLPR